jgi:Rha family phage regulatory protein
MENSVPALGTSTEIEAPELMLIDGQAFCTSLQVAEHFEKTHANVLKDIERTIEQVFENPNKVKSYAIENLFQTAEYEITSGIGAQVKKPMYYLTRDGFTLLAMSYTGAKAMQFKLAYMDAFNRMEEALKYQLDKTETINNEQLRHLEWRIQQMAIFFHMKESAQQWLQNMLRFHFSIKNLSQLKAEDFPKAVLLLERAAKESNEYLDMRLELEKIILRDYLCQGLPFTGVLSRQFSKAFQQRLPDRPDWRAVVERLEQQG